MEVSGFRVQGLGFRVQGSGFRDLLASRGFLLRHGKSQLQDGDFIEWAAWQPPEMQQAGLGFRV